MSMYNRFKHAFDEDKEDMKIMKNYDTATLKANGETIKVATDGQTVRIISMNHMFVEIQLQADRNYGLPLDGIVDGFEYKNENGIPVMRYKKPKDFIDDKEMEL